jgi:hypothetical protein
MKGLVDECILYHLVNNLFLNYLTKKNINGFLLFFLTLENHYIEIGCQVGN